MFNIGDKVKFQAPDRGRIYHVADIRTRNNIPQIKVYYDNMPYWCDSSSYELASPKARFKVGDKVVWRAGRGSPIYSVISTKYEYNRQQLLIEVLGKKAWYNASDFILAPQQSKEEGKKMKTTYRKGDEVWVKSVVTTDSTTDYLLLIEGAGGYSPHYVNVKNIVKHIPRVLKMKVGSLVRNDRSWQGWSNTATVVWLDDKEALVSWSDSGGKQLKKRSELVVVSE